MSDNERNVANTADDQGANEDESRDRMPAGATSRSDDDGQAQPGLVVPADDDIIIK